MSESESESTRIVIVGGGAAALEAMLALHALGGDRARIELFAPGDDFVLRPLAISEAFGAGELLQFDLGELTSQYGAVFQRSGVEAVEPEHHRVILREKKEVNYDYLIVATGTKSLWDVPGANTFWGPGSEETISEALSLIRSGRGGKIILTIPEGPGWPLPIYELALHLSAEAEKASSEIRIDVVSPEREPLEVFGKRSSRVVEKLIGDRGIGFVGRTAPVEFSGGSLKTDGPGSIEAAMVVSLPRLTGRVPEGLPVDENGFVPVDDAGRIEGLEREYAAGDLSSSRLKYGSVATAQADAVAASIAAEAWDPRIVVPTPEDPKAMLLTPEGPVFIGEDEDWSDLDQEVASERWDPATKLHGTHLTPALTRMSRGVAGGE